MNKKILLSAAAAATLALTFTGCGSSSSSAGSSASGVAQKAPLNGATVNIGGATATTASDGTWTVTGISGSSIEVTGGNMLNKDGNASVGTNTLTLKSRISASNPDNTVSLVSTFIEDFLTANGDSNITKAQNQAASLFGLSDPYAQPEAMTDAQKLQQVTLFNALKAAKAEGTDSNATTALMTSLRTSANATGAAIASFATLINQAMADMAANSDMNVTDLNTSSQVLVTAAAAGLDEIAALQAINDGNVTTAYINSVTTAYSDVLNLDTNGSANSGAYGYKNGTNAMEYLPYTTTGTIDTNTSVFDDTNNTRVIFKVEDNTTGGLTEAENGTMTLILQNLETNTTTDANASYKMVLSNLTVEANGGYVQFEMNQNVSAAITANSNTSTSMSYTATYSSTDTNTSAISGTNLLDFNSTGSSTMAVNIATFANYVKGIAESESSTTNGNFSVDMTGNGNYSLKIYATAGSEQFTFKDGKNKAPKYTEGYKIIDANLNK